jgi:hypothetical protein
MKTVSPAVLPGPPPAVVQGPPPTLIAGPPPAMIHGPTTTTTVVGGPPPTLIEVGGFPTPVREIREVHHTHVMSPRILSPEPTVREVRTVHVERRMEDRCEIKNELLRKLEELKASQNDTTKKMQDLLDRNLTPQKSKFSMNFHYFYFLTSVFIYTF